MKKILFATILFSLIFALAACGGEEADQSSNNATGDNADVTQLDISATNFDLGQEEYTVNAGEEVKITLTNEEGMHGISIDEFDVHIEGEGEATFTPDEPGEYTIYCNIPCGNGHGEMQTTLVVQ
ncbi:cytochrome c oxidase subunit 2 [Oceanobacillus limi]|uniref:Cytochrome c oxidase subunit 2 n=1 Tax=Oceanobacillus limi TaxID=930131 RepID=A0A1I0B9F1_9BACI|nr:hypothetical protein [Oceanobacillus limi]SET03425.1 cytochrome c oxidase subunit 2 [Oceanobacillus limi]